MLNLKKILSRSLLALALGACGSAFAGPVYHVAIDTAGLGSGTAFLDLVLGAETGAAPVTANLSHLEGAFGEYTDRSGDSSGNVSGGVTLVNDASYSDLFQAILLGGLFTFDLSFDSGANPGGNPTGTTFSASLYNGDLSDYLALPANLVEISLMPGQADVVSPANAYARVSTDAAAVPEPSALLLVAIGLIMAMATLRRRA